MLSMPDQSFEAERIRSLLASTGDRSLHSPELERMVEDWTTYYHLSSRRALALQPVRHLIGGKILESSAECGAITRFLGETGGEVFALESVPERAEAARLRCADLSNVTIGDGSVFDLPKTLSFDTIVTYSAEHVANLGESLGPDGRLLLLASNALWPAISSDAESAAPGGPDGPPVLGARTLEKRLQSCGFSFCEFGFLFPDRDFPATVLTPEALTTDRFDASTFFDIRTMLFRRPGFVEPPLNWAALRRAGLLGEFASGFVVVARKSKPATRAFSGLVYMYSMNRTARFAKETVIEESGEELLVRRRRVSATPHADTPGRFSNVLRDEPWIAGEAYDKSLSSILKRQGWGVEELAAWALPWIEFLRASGTVQDGRIILPDDYLDCTPFNIVVDAAGRLRPFDLEYASWEPIDIEFVAFRGLWGALVRQKSCAVPRPGTSGNVLTLVSAVLRLSGVPLSERRISELIELETLFQHEVTGAAFEATEFMLRHQPISVSDPEFERASLQETHFVSQLFWRTPETGYSEENSVSVNCLRSTIPQTFRIPVPSLNKIPSAVRWDMADRTGLLELRNLTFLDSQGETVWSMADYPGSLAFLSATQTRILPNQELGGPQTLVLEGPDPWVELAMDAAHCNRIAGGGALVIECVWLDSQESPQTFEESFALPNA